MLKRLARDVVSQTVVIFVDYIQSEADFDIVEHAYQIVWRVTKATTKFFVKRIDL